MTSATGARTAAGARAGAEGLPQQMRLGRYPGPVWMLAVWSFVSAANLAFALVFPANNKPPNHVTGTSLALAVGMTVFLLVVGERTPNWLVWLLFGAGVAATLWMSWDAATTPGTALFVLPTVIFTTYVALWAPRWAAFTFLAALATAVLLLFAAKGVLTMLLVSWVLLMSMAAALVALLTYLVDSLRNLATTDPLTGLLNRQGLEEFVRVTPSGGRRTAPRTLVVIDLDGFKQINDSYGHQAGDDLLRTFGLALRQCARQDDIIARTGGDEFLLILPATPAADAERLHMRLREAHPARWSHGIAAWAPHTTFDDAFAAADARMYERKQRRSSGSPDLRQP